MKKTFLFLFVAFLGLGTYAQTTWKSDPAHSQISFAITHSSISEVEGLFQDFDITINSSEEDFSDAQYKMTLDVGSIDTHVEMRDNHLKSPDFFNAEKFPTITFNSNKVEEISENRYKITGPLTMHGITKPVSLEVWYRGTNETEKATVSGFQITGTLKRSDFNIGPDFPEAVLSDKVKIKVDAEFKKQ